MAKKNGNGSRNGNRRGDNGGNGRPGSDRRDTTRPYEEPGLHPDTKNSIWAASFACVGIILVLARFAKAGPAGGAIFEGLSALFGWGYFILPATLFFAAIVFIFAGRKQVALMTLIGALLLVLSFLGLVEIASPGNGGWLGLVLGSLRSPFGAIAASVINVFILIIAVLVTANVPLKIRWPRKSRRH
jgi:hypothetical protein